MLKISKWHIVPTSLLLSVLASDCAEKSWPDEEKATDQNGQYITHGCANDSQCAPYKQCITGGTVGCSQGDCYGYNVQRINFDCIKNIEESNPSTNTATCGPVEAPPELKQIDPVDQTCHFSEGLRAGYNQSRPWLQITADTQGSTVTIYELSSYCLHPDGTWVPNSGTAIGKPAITWAISCYRDTWYRAGNNHGDECTTLTVQNDKTPYAVPLNPLLLHMGQEGWDITGCKEIVAKVVFSTTGDAKLEAGLDYWISANDHYESGVSGWKSCTSSTTTLMTPRSDTQTCDGPSNICIPAAEVCDGLDNDCDGQTDEDGVCNTAPPPSDTFTINWAVNQTASQMNISGMTYHGSSYTAWSTKGMSQNQKSVSASLSLASGWCIEFNANDSSGHWACNGPFPPGTAYGALYLTQSGSPVSGKYVDNKQGGCNIQYCRP